MHPFLHALNKGVLLGDGAMGTMLQTAGLPRGEMPERWMKDNPDAILEIHRAYVMAGASILETNTFGASPFKLQEYGIASMTKTLNTLAAKLARKAATPNCFVAGVIGPCGSFPAPLSPLSFEEIKEAYKIQVEGLIEGGVDLFLLQTFSDLGEARAALLAVKELCNLPVGVSMTYGDHQRTLTGSDAQTVATVFSAMGADFLGINCSTGPEEMLPILKTYQDNCGLPLLAEPNAGLPVLRHGESIFPMSADDMASFVPQMVALGVRWLGSCCGSTPEHTNALKKALEKSCPPDLPKHRIFPSRLCSRSQTLELGSQFPTRLIGERINPTARKALAEALRENRYDRLLQEAQLQIEAGAELLDVNTGLAGGDETMLLPSAILEIQKGTDCPLVIDSVKPNALEKALCAYQGKALINSVNAEPSSMAQIFPLAKRYGAAVLGLTLDKNGIPEKGEDRFKLAKTLLEKAREYGLPDEDVFIDCLVLSVASDSNSARETLEAIRLVKERLGLTTVLGLSNISHGMPQRSWLNHAFLAQALASGLDAVIANPLDDGIRHMLIAGNLLSGRDALGLDYIKKAQIEEEKGPSLQIQRNEKRPLQKSSEKASHHPLVSAILKGDQKGIEVELDALVPTQSFLQLIQTYIVPALEQAGDTFATGETFLPQLLLSADGARMAFDYLKITLPEQPIELKETVLLGTVEGDVHDIGKNIVKALLESHGYRIIDLGKNVAKETFVEAALQHQADVIGLSALMTTTMPEMEFVIKSIRKAGLKAKVIVGGAVLTPEYAQSIQADAYVKDAAQAHPIIRSFFD